MLRAGFLRVGGDRRSLAPDSCLHPRAGRRGSPVVPGLPILPGPSWREATMPRSRWLAAVLLLCLSARHAAAQAPLAWHWQEKDPFYVEWTAHIKTAHKTAL